MTSEGTKELVREKYSEIARSNTAGCGCGCGCSDVNFIGEDYKNVEGYLPDADLGLGCGVPTEVAGIKEGDTVVDLGSGAGNDVFVARAEVGPSGRVIGIDFSNEMIARANINKEKLGYANVEFVYGDIETLPLTDATADVVISNCVLNLVPDKAKAFSEIYRVLKPGGHFCVSDVIATQDLPEMFKRDAELYAGCIGGALERGNYLRIVEETGFAPVEIHSERPIDLPGDLQVQLAQTGSGTGLYSITLSGYKPN